LVELAIGGDAIGGREVGVGDRRAPLLDRGLHDQDPWCQQTFGFGVGLDQMPKRQGLSTGGFEPVLDQPIESLQVDAQALDQWGHGGESRALGPTSLEVGQQGVQGVDLSRDPLRTFSVLLAGRDRQQGGRGGDDPLCLSRQLL